MADIFISYTKADRDKVVMLSAYLESEGWTVWWDTNLSPGDAYRDEIMRQLAAARAVIVLWTQTSIKSDFVRAEAGRAKADSKLIPVKESDVEYRDIPVPFGEMHTEDFSKRELIRAAVGVQLAKPQVQPSALWVATKTLRYQVLTWFGIIGGAITLFSTLQGVLKLADWARLLVSNWQDWTTTVWGYAFSWLGIRVPKDWIPLLTFTTFSVMTAVGSRIYANAEHERHVSIKRHLAALCLFVFGLFVASFGINFLMSKALYNFSLNIYSIFLAGASIILLSIMLGAVVKINYVTAIYFATMFGIFYYIIPITYGFGWPKSVEGAIIYLGAQAFHAGLDPRFIFDGAFALTFGALFYILAAIMLMISPSGAITKRLSFLLIGLVILVVLNQLSQYATYIREVIRATS